MTYDEERLVRLLTAIKDIALLPYPFRNDERNDPALVLVLGQIAGTAMKALEDHKDRENDAA